MYTINHIMKDLKFVDLCLIIPRGSYSQIMVEHLEHGLPWLSKKLRIEGTYFITNSLITTVCINGSMTFMVAGVIDEFAECESSRVVLSILHSGEHGIFWSTSVIASPNALKLGDK
ncbi:hypothetical protein Tco_1027023 [Tanacetum coccineum]